VTAPSFLKAVVGFSLISFAVAILEYHAIAESIRTAQFFEKLLIAHLLYWGFHHIYYGRFTEPRKGINILSREETIVQNIESEELKDNQTIYTPFCLSHPGIRAISIIIIITVKRPF
jgi:hypothetical protein